MFIDNAAQGKAQARQKRKEWHPFTFIITRAGIFRQQHFRGRLAIMMLSGVQLIQSATRLAGKRTISGSYAVPFFHRHFSKESSAEPSAEAEIDRRLYTKEIKVRMPDMGAGEGRVLEWLKEEGDIIYREDVLCDIETDDFTFGMQTDDEDPAIMGKILYDAPSEPIKDEDVICIILHKEEKRETESVDNSAQ